MWDDLVQGQSSILGSGPTKAWRTLGARGQPLHPSSVAALLHHPSPPSKGHACSPHSTTNTLTLLLLDEPEGMNVVKNPPKPGQERPRLRGAVRWARSSGSVTRRDKGED